MNRAARISNSAHGGQVLLSQAVAALLANRLPEGVTLKDLGQVRLRDLASPERLFQVMHPQLRDKFPALRTLEATPNNLTQQLTSFVGRQRELDEVRALLRNTRLLTLFGAGGIGKTRLSQQLAADVMDDFPDGVWFVELAPLSDPRLVPQSVAFVLGVKEEAGRPVVEALLKFVHDRRLLLVLDNCEHLVQACAELVTQLLQAGSHVKVLASSREHLHIAGESSYPVPALAVPEQGKAIELATFTRYEAVLLFVDRASAVQPSFSLTKENAAAVADICQRLDGIPLAIELAAARVRTLSVQTIAKRLDDRFRLLDAAATARRCRASRRCARSSTGATTCSPSESASCCAGCRSSPAAGRWRRRRRSARAAISQNMTCSTCLSNLVEKSLVNMDAEGGRYRLVETVRQYAQERLDDVRRGGRDAHAPPRVLPGAGRKGRPAVSGPEQGAWLARLDLEGENLLAAHAWCDRARRRCANWDCGWFSR